MKRNNFGFCALLLFCVLWPGCSANSTILNSGSKEPGAANAVRPVNVFESDLESMRTANFDFIFVLRRKDGGKLDAEDKKFVRSNSPAVANRIILSDDDKALIAGSNYPFPPEKLKPLQERFDFQDFSKPGNTGGDKNVNANTN
jgi:hypothetical protein